MTGDRALEYSTDESPWRPRQAFHPDDELTAAAVLQHRWSAWTGGREARSRISFFPAPRSGSASVLFRTCRGCAHHVSALLSVHPKTAW
jgi:hypothetical protein